MGNEVKIIINADGTAAIEGIGKVTGSMQKMETETGGIVSKIKSHWLALSAAVAGAMVTIHQAWNMAEMAAAYEEQKASLNALAAQYDTTATAIIDDIKRASQGLIAMDDAARIAGVALTKNLKPDQLIQLAEAAETLSNVSGEKVPQAFENLVGAIALGRERALEASVGIIDLNARFGEQINKMSDAEKAAARYNMVMEKVRVIQEQLGPSIDSTADKMDRLRITIHELQLTVGTLIIRLAAGAMGVVNFFRTIGAGFGAEVLKPFAFIEEQLNKIGIAGTTWQDMWKDYSETAEKARQGTIDNFNVMIAKSEDLKKAGAPLKDIANNVTSVSDAAKNAAEKIRELNKSIQGMIDQATLSPIALIEKQAEEWRKAGADRVLIEKWVQIEIDKVNKQAEEEAKMRADEEKMRAKELALAKANIAQQEVETLIGIEQKLIDYRLNVGEISETEAIKQRYDLETKVLESRQEQLIVQMSQETNEARFLELQAQYYNIQKQIEASREYEVYELQEAEKKNQEELLAAEQKKLELMQQQYETTWQYITSLVGSLEGEMAKGMGMVATGLKGLMDIWKLEDAYNSAIEYHDKVVELFAKNQATVVDVLKAYNAEVLAEEKYTAAARVGIYQNMAAMMAGTMYSLYVASGEQSETLFTLYKAFAIAQAIMNTYEGATKALAQGGIYGIATAAMVVATGLAYVAQIAAQQPGGSTSSTSTYTEPTTTEAAQSAEVTEPKEVKTPVITVNIYSTVFDQSTLDDLARQLQTSLAKAVSDGVH